MSTDKGCSVKRIQVGDYSGFIGANFVRYLLETDPTAKITILGALTYAGNPDDLADIESNSRYQFIQSLTATITW